MELLANNTTVNAYAFENITSLSSGVVTSIQIESITALVPAPFYDELHFANYE